MKTMKEKIKIEIPLAYFINALNFLGNEYRKRMALLYEIRGDDPSVLGEPRGYVGKDFMKGYTVDPETFKDMWDSSMNDIRRANAYIEAES